MHVQHGDAVWVENSHHFDSVAVLKRAAEYLTSEAIGK